MSTRRSTRRAPTAAAPSGASDAASVTYDNATSGLAADDVQDAIDELSNGTSTAGPILHFSLPFDHTDSAALAAGMTVVTPEVGDILLDAWIDVSTAFDGTTPQGEIGTFTLFTFGLFSGYGQGTVLLGQAASEDFGGIIAGGQPTLLAQTNANVLSQGDVTGVPARITAANPIKVVASQNGEQGGTAINSTAGAATAHVLLLRPSAA